MKKRCKCVTIPGYGIQKERDSRGYPPGACNVRMKRFNWIRIIALMMALLLFTACGKATTVPGDFTDEDETAVETLLQNGTSLYKEDLPEGEAPMIIPEEEQRKLGQTGTVTGQGNIPLKVRMDLDPEKKMVALTFDDGPSEYTDRVLDALNKVGGKGTFFVVGDRLGETGKARVRRIIEEGHEIGSHTWKHSNLSKLGHEAGKNAIGSVEEVIEEIGAEFNYEMNVFRPPYGAVNSTVKEVAADMKLAIMYWSVDTLDWKHRTASKTVANVKSEVTNGSIVLFHDIYDPTADAVEEIIPWLVDQGYQLVTCSELLYYQNDGATAGKIYYNT